MGTETMDITTFTGRDWLLIDIANCFGKDKETWADRLLWAEIHLEDLELMAPAAESELLFKKAVHAYRMAMKGLSIGHNMFLDACNSGAQIYAVLTGCKTTAANCGLVDIGYRVDAYTKITHTMDDELGGDLAYPRADIKGAVMKALYNSKKAPKDLCGEDTPELNAFYNSMHKELPGAMQGLAAINSYWNSTKLVNEFTLPDGHTAYIPVTEMRSTRIEVDELDHTTFTYQYESNEPSDNGRSLAPNIIHAIDGYVVREMVRRAKEQGFELAHIHDSFCAHPNYMSKVVDNYRTILAEIADSNLLGDILSELSQSTVQLNKLSTDLSSLVKSSEYGLS